MWVCVSIHIPQFIIDSSVDGHLSFPVYNYYRQCYDEHLCMCFGAHMCTFLCKARSRILGSQTMPNNFSKFLFQFILPPVIHKNSLALQTFTNKILLEHRHTCEFTIFYGQFHATTTELNSYDRDICPMHQFPWASITNEHKLNGLKHTNVFSHSSRSQKSEFRVLTEQHSLWRIQGRIFRCPIQALAVPQLPWILATTLPSLPQLHVAFCSLPYVSCKDTYHIQTHLDNPD